MTARPLRQINVGMALDLKSRPPRGNAGPRLAEELAALAENEWVEMTNLHEKDTGEPGVIFISTAMGEHGPRVKYFLKAGWRAALPTATCAAPRRA
jgi:hypothetical protein